MSVWRRPQWAAALTFLVGATIAVAGAGWLAHRDALDAKHRLEVVARRFASDIETRMNRYEHGLRGARGAEIAAGGIDRRRYHDYASTRDLATEFPGARAIGIIRRVKAADEAHFVATTRARDWPDFAVRQLTPHTGDRYVIQFVEPLASNEAAIGLDVASEKERREAAQRSMWSGKATLTGPIRLVQAPEGKASFLLMLPIYGLESPTSTPEERELATIAWSYAPLTLDGILDGLDTLEPDVDLTIRDVASDSPPFHRSSGVASDDAPRRTLHLDVYGRPWELDVRATPAFLHALHHVEPHTIGVSGVALAAVLAVLIGLSARGIQRARMAANEQARRAAIVDSSSDAIIGESMDGIVTDWNRGAERLLGFAAADAVGQRLAALVLPLERSSEHAALRVAAMSGEPLPALDTLRRRADGTLIEVSITFAPIHAPDGRQLGISWAMRDISEARRAQRELATLNENLEAQVSERTEMLESAQRDLRMMIDAVPPMVAYWDRDLVNRIANRATGEWLGLSPEDLQGCSLRDLFDERVFERGRGRVEQVLRGEPQTFEDAIRSPDGSITRRMLIHYIPDVVDDEVRGFYSVFADVTEVFESRRELVDNQALLRAIQQHAIVSVADASGRIIQVSDKFCEISGYAREELVGQNHNMINSGVHRREFWRGLWLTVQRGRAWRREVCNRAKDGSLYWVDAIVAPVLGSDGRVDKYISVRTDITARKRLQLEVDHARALAEEQERFLREITDRVPLRIAYLDRHLRHRFVNQAYCDGLDLSRAQILGRSEAEIAGGEVSPERQAAAAAVLQGQVQRYEIDEEHEGSSNVIDWHLVPDRDANALLQGFYAVGNDVTASKRDRQELYETSSLLQGVLAAASEFSIIATDVHGTITVFNHGAERLLGHTPGDMVGRATPAVLHVEAEVARRSAELTAALGRPVEGFEVFVAIAAQGDCETREWTYVRRDGRHLPVSLTVSVLRDAGGQIVGYLGIAHDISKQKEEEASLQVAVLKAKQASRAKSEFLANMSHEIRTPMNAVIGLTYLLERTHLDAEQSEFLGKIRVASKSLLATINDVLDVSKIEAGELRIETAPFDLVELLGELRMLMSVAAEEKRVQFTIETADDLPVSLAGDAARLHQILVNLVSNGIKFTEHGSVRLVVAERRRSSGASRLRFVVEDQGIGIDATAIPRLFTPFSQADASTTRQFGGTGLGLSIVRNLVKLMGGELGVSSQPGVGTTFWVELEFARQSAQSGARLAAILDDGLPRLSGLRVLVADDSAINLEVARRVLEAEGATVRVATNGRQATDLLTEHATTTDVVLMDMHMPVMDGFEATRRIRGDLGLAHVPVIALTAGTLGSEKQRARAVGVSAFVTKPFEPRALVRCILQHVTPPAPIATQTPVRPPSPAADDAWPTFDGVDAADARIRLGGDLGLLLTLLRRLAHDFVDLKVDVTSTTEQLDALALRMHDLKGSAGSLGARSIERSAREIESYCRLRRIDRIVTGVARLRRELELLAAQLDASARGDEPVHANVTATPTVDPAALAELVEHLRQSKLDAVERFRDLSGMLRESLGEAPFAKVREQIDSLEFERAAESLSRLRAG